MIQQSERVSRKDGRYVCKAGIDTAGVCAEYGVRYSGCFTGQRVSGRFGVFYEGRLAAHYLDASGKQVHKEVIATVDPLKACVLSRAVKPVKSVSSVSLHLYDKNGRDL